MGSHKRKEHLNKIKDAVINSKDLNENDKTNTLKHIDEWLLEDKADGLFVEELLKLNSAIKPILAELGLI